MSKNWKNKVGNWFNKADKKIDEFFSGDTDKRVASTQISWFLHYGLKPDEVPDRIKNVLTEEEFTKIVRRKVGK